jgi:hypothetical protein
MNRKLAIPASIALAVAITSPAAATHTRTPYACEAWYVTQLVDGDFWVDADGVIQMRGSVLEYQLVGDDLCAGTLIGSANFTFDPATASGVVWGRSIIELDAYEGGWVANLNAHWTNADPLAPNAEDIWVGMSVRHGFGELEGWQARSTLVERFHWLFLDEGFAFAAGG